MWIGYVSKLFILLPGKNKQNCSFSIFLLHWFLLARGASGLFCLMNRGNGRTIIGCSGRKNIRNNGTSKETDSGFTG